MASKPTPQNNKYLAKKQVRSFGSNNPAPDGSAKLNMAEKKELRRMQDSSSAHSNTMARMKTAKEQANKAQLQTKTKPATMASKKSSGRGGNYA
jgi:hypothetical protein